MISLRTLAALLILPFAATASAGDLPPPHSVTYSLSKGGVVGARLTATLEHLPGPRIRIVQKARPAGLLAFVRLFADVEVTESTLVAPWKDGWWRPLEYHYRQTGGDKARTGDYRFDWSARRASGQVKGRPFTLEDIPETMQDRLSLGFQTMLDLRNTGRLRDCYPILNRGKADEYCFRIAGRERLDTALGRFDTIRVERTDNPKRRTVTWYAPDLEYLAVRIEQVDEKDGRLTMEIESLTGIPLPAGADNDEDLF